MSEKLTNGIDKDYFVFFIWNFHWNFLVKSIFGKRFANLSSAITNRLWLNAHTNYECDVLLTFPEKIDDNVIIWFLEKFLQLEPDIRISIKHHFTTGKIEISFFFFRKLIGCLFLLYRCLWILFNLYLWKVRIFWIEIGLRIFFFV